MSWSFRPQMQRTLQPLESGDLAACVAAETSPAFADLPGAEYRARTGDIQLGNRTGKGRRG